MIFSHPLRAQITIGLDKPAVTGALLDLKEQETTGGESNSSRGLLLPRVLLTDKANLYPMFKAGTDEYKDQEKQTQDLNHIGLIVYNVGKCTLDGSGIYVWTSNGWQYLEKGTNMGGLNTSVDQLMFYNKPAASGTIASQFIDLSWNSTGTDIPTMSYSPTGGFLSVKPTTITSSPTKLEVNVAEMSPTDLSTNRFMSKNGEIILTLANSPCGDAPSMTQTKKIPVNLINKTVYVASDPIYTTSSIKEGTTPIESNANWILSNMISLTSTYPEMSLTDAKVGVKKALPIGAGANWENNTGSKGGSGTLTAKVASDTKASRYNYVYLADNSNPKRFDDVMITVLQCDLSISPSMEEWAELAGFPYVPKSSGDNTADIAAGRDVPNSTTGIAWHRDQDGNVFLSGAFGKQANGKERRWMITNLGAKEFSRSGRTGDDKTIVREWGKIADNKDFYTSFKGDNHVLLVPPMYARMASPLWCYPFAGGTEAHPLGYEDTDYVKDKRMGLFYNFYAASNFKENNSPQLTPATNTDKIQGICPNGWHLPSYPEVIDMINEVRVNTSLYSRSASRPDLPAYVYDLGTPNNNRPIGAAFKDYCSIENKNPSTPVSVFAGQATSNPINTTQMPGYNAVFSGCIENQAMHNFKQLSYIWTSSTYTIDHSAIFGVMIPPGDDLVLNYKAKADYMNVRCVQDF